MEEHSIVDWWTLVGDSQVYLSGLVERQGKDPIAFPEATFDAVITDPPYEINISGKEWDRSGIAWDPDFWRSVYRVLKPGGYLISFAATRTYHRMASAVDTAGFEIRDMLSWMYGQGNPMAQEIEGHEGWFSRLKPACEPMVLARKEMLGTLKETMDVSGVGGINVEATRVGERWPANVIMDEEAGALIDAQAAKGIRPSRFFYCPKPDSVQKDAGLEAGGFTIQDRDTFKISGTGSKGYNLHATVKPVDLMRWLVRLVTPRGGLVLDPFLGSGTTGLAARAEGCRFTGIDLDPEYVKLADARYSYMMKGGAL